MVPYIGFCRDIGPELPLRLPPRPDHIPISPWLRRRSRHPQLSSLRHTWRTCRRAGSRRNRRRRPGISTRLRNCRHRCRPMQPTKGSCRPCQPARCRMLATPQHRPRGSCRPCQPARCRMFASSQHRFRGLRHGKSRSSRPVVSSLFVPNILHGFYYSDMTEKSGSTMALRTDHGLVAPSTNM